MVLGETSHPCAPDVDLSMLQGFNSVGRGKALTEHCLDVCNQSRPNSALDPKTPNEAYFAPRPRPMTARELLGMQFTKRILLFKQSGPFLCLSNNPPLSLCRRAADYAMYTAIAASTPAAVEVI